jgi:hypothetical protein
VPVSYADNVGSSGRSSKIISLARNRDVELFLASSANLVCIHLAQVRINKIILIQLTAVIAYTVTHS